MERAAFYRGNIMVSGKQQRYQHQVHNIKKNKGAPAGGRATYNHSSIIARAQTSGRGNASLPACLSTGRGMPHIRRRLRRGGAMSKAAIPV